MTENCKFRKAILSAFYNISERNFGNITNFVMLFHAMMEFCLDLLRSKFWLIGEWSIELSLCCCGNLGLKKKSFFFQRDWPRDPIFSGWLRAAHTACQNGVCYHTNYWTKLPKLIHRKYASLVDIDVGTLLKIAQQKIAETMKTIPYYRKLTMHFINATYINTTSN